LAADDARPRAADPPLPEEDPRLPEEDPRLPEDAARLPPDEPLPEDELPEERDPDAERRLVVREADGVAAAAAALGLDLLDVPDFPLEEERLDAEPDEDRVRLLPPLLVAISMHLFVGSRSCYPRAGDR
jgi:hypothetical protein